MTRPAKASRVRPTGSQGGVELWIRIWGIEGGPGLTYYEAVLMAEGAKVHCRHAHESTSEAEGCAWKLKKQIEAAGATG